MLVAALGLSAPVAADEDGTLAPYVADVRPGEIVTIFGEFCTSGRQATGATLFTRGDRPKGPTIAFPLTLGDVQFQQSTTGISFIYAAGEERTYSWVTVTCNDGTSATSQATPVTVWPAKGSLWFHSPYDRLGAASGQQTVVEVSSLDCVEGSTATIDLIDEGSSIAAATAPVADRWMRFALAVPRSAASGEREVEVSCDAIDGGRITDRHQFTVFSDAPPVIPRTGLRADLVLWAGLLVALGLTLRTTTRSAIGRQR